MRTLTICALLFLNGILFAQGPIGGFPTPKGEVAIALGYSTDNYTTYLGRGGVEEAREVATTSYSLFVEAGVSDNTSLVATLPYLRTNDREGSLQDASLWLKYLNREKRGKTGTSRIFTAIGLSFPVGNYETTGIAALGQRASVFQGRLVYQYQHDGGFFLNAQSGIDFQFAPEGIATWPVLLRTGYGAKYFFVEGWVEFITALGSDTDVQTATAGSGSSWTRVGATLYVPVIEQFGLVGGAARVLGGEFIGLSNRINLGVVIKL